MSTRIPQLDLLRGIAVSLVLLCHYPYFETFTLGWVGVDLFFVLSGFLISGLLFVDWKANGTIRLSRFYIRRGFKIYPAFYFMLLTTSWAYMLGRPEIWRRPFATFGAEFFFLQDYLPGLWPHTWSLAVEEQFYLLLPVLLLALTKVGSRRKPFRAVPLLALVVMIGCLAARIASHPRAAEDVRWAFHYRADALLAGVALGYLFHFHPAIFSRMSRWFLLPVAVILLAPVYVCTSARAAPWVLTCNVLAFSSLVLFVVPRSRLRFRWLELVGVYSYSIYLWHVPISVIFRGNFPHNLFWLFPYLAASIGFGVYMAKIIEFRALAYRDRFLPAAAKPTAVPLAVPRSRELTARMDGSLSVPFATIPPQIPD